MSARWGPDFVLITDNGIYANEWDLKNLTANEFNKININTLWKALKMFILARHNEIMNKLIQY